MLGPAVGYERPLVSTGDAPDGNIPGGTIVGPAALLLFADKSGKLDVEAETVELERDAVTGATTTELVALTLKLGLAEGAAETKPVPCGTELNSVPLLRIVSLEDAGAPPTQ